MAKPKNQRKPEPQQNIKQESAAVGVNGITVTVPKNPVRDEAILTLAKMGLKLAEHLAAQPELRIMNNVIHATGGHGISIETEK